MKFKIFISSVQNEFAKARSAIAEMVRKDRLLNCFFETFVFEKGAARDRKARNVYLDAVADCDIYLVLCGDKYGNADAKGVSPTEHEFDKATELKKLRLAFVKKSFAKREKREVEFVGKIGEELAWRSFSSLASLKDAVYDALFCWLQERDIVASKPYDKSASLEVTMDDLDPEYYPETSDILRGLRLDSGLPKTLTGQIEDGIRGLIAGGAYAPGDSLPARDVIAKSLGVSECVVRAALRRLAADGIVVSRPRIGCVVQKRPVAARRTVLDVHIDPWTSFGPSNSMFQCSKVLRAEGCRVAMLPLGGGGDRPFLVPLKDALAENPGFVGTGPMSYLRIP